MSDIQNHESNHEIKNEVPTFQSHPEHWTSLEQYSRDPEFLKMAEAEFQSSPLREDADPESGWARREFLKLMGASMALSAAACVRRPAQKIVPYNKQPEEVTLGIPNFYTSTHFDGSQVLGVLVKTREGRPIKVEGNPSSPFNKGALSILAQASILNMYDPERLQGPKKNLLNEKKTNKDTIGTTWEAIDDAVVAQLKKGSVALLTGNISSPSTKQVIKDFAQGFNAQHVTWEALANEDVQQGQKLSYGEAIVPAYRFDKAKMIVSIDADFLGTWLTPVVFSRQFSQGRKDIEKMSRLVTFESNYTLTGANADIRLRIKPSQQLSVVMGLAHEIIVTQGKTSYASSTEVKEILKPYANAASDLGIETELFKRIASDLAEQKGKGLVVAGGLAATTPWQAALQVAVNFLNSALENEGSTVNAAAALTSLTASYSALINLIKDMNSGKVKTLILHKVNPIYVLPASFGFIDALKKVEMVLYTGNHMDETAVNAHFVIPDNHALENWGDAELAKGVVAIQQPAIRPLYDTRSFQLSLMTWAFMAKVGPARIQEFETYYDYLRDFWKREVHPQHGKGMAFEAFWDQVLQNGSAGTASEGSARKFKVESLKVVQSAKVVGSEFELVLYPTSQMGDGLLSNVSWLHELPDPVTKIVWDNYASISLATSQKLGLKEASVIELEVNGEKLELPVHVQPGLHDGVVAVAVGYGRTMAGKVANGVGQNAYVFVKNEGDVTVFSGSPSKITKTKKKYQLACTQDHHSMNDGYNKEPRPLALEVTLKDYEKSQSAGIHKHHIWSIWSGHQYSGHKWGMAVDLNSCTGCSACVVACQSENNVPVVGKKYMLQGREMHWIRIDRYYVGTPENPSAVFQAIMCQHCDNAPCETVCPVAATVHNSEGLNDMAYNRCVGTRYCANNCPYKVRRFNWFNYAKNIEKPVNMSLNPEVTVRVRGVMEKCSFCVQRIKEGKSKAKLEGRPLKDGDVKTACQTSCPTDAIIFGDVNDENSEVSKAFHKDPRSYALLEEWHAKPAVRYLTKIRNNGKETAGHDAHGTQKQGEHS